MLTDVLSPLVSSRSQVSTSSGSRIMCANVPTHSPPDAAEPSSSGHLWVSRTFPQPPHPSCPTSSSNLPPLRHSAKWALVAAGVKDLGRPADKLSVSQNVALAATGFIWVRYSFVIIPVNYSLAAVSGRNCNSIPGNWRLMCVGYQVNFFVGSTGLGQLYRIWECVAV